MDIETVTDKEQPRPVAQEDREVLLEVEGLHLVFELRFYKTPSWRDAFVNATRNFFDYLLSEEDKLHVLEGVNFKIHRGDKIGLLGLNGVGKTSLCRVLAGMHAPSKGTVRRNVPVRAIFDTSVGVHPELTGRENARLLSKLMFPGRVDHREIAEAAVEFSELGEFADMSFKWYSNGMQTRLCLSVISAIAHDLLILDEVFTGADESFSKKIEKRVLKMIHASGAVVFVTHSPEQVLRICNRVMVLSEGKIAFDGDPEEGVTYYRSINNNPLNRKFNPA